MNRIVIRYLRASARGASRPRYRSPSFALRAPARRLPPATRGRHASLLKNDVGMAMVEFALMLPVLMTFFYGCIELTRYILIAQKVEKFAYTVADVGSQNKTLSIADITGLLEASGEIMKPFSFGNNGRVFITSLYRPDGAANAKVNWRYSSSSTLGVSSKFGAIDAIPTMPGTFTFDNKENVIAAEVYYQFAPILTSQFFGTTTIYRAAFYKPRLGSLTSAPT